MINEHDLWQTYNHSLQVIMYFSLLIKSMLSDIFAFNRLSTTQYYSCTARSGSRAACARAWAGEGGNDLAPVRKLPCLPLPFGSR